MLTGVLRPVSISVAIFAIFCLQHLVELAMLCVLFVSVIVADVAKCSFVLSRVPHGAFVCKVSICGAFCAIEAAIICVVVGSSAPCTVEI